MWRLRCVASRDGGPLDLVARYGGEELIAVLFGADRAHAENVARAVREAVRSCDPAHRLDDAAVRHRERRRRDSGARLEYSLRRRRAAGGSRALRRQGDAAATAGRFTTRRVVHFAGGFSRASLSRAAQVKRR